MLNYQRVIKPRIDSQGWKWSGVDTTIKVVYYYTGTKVFWEFHFWQFRHTKYARAKLCLRPIVEKTADRVLVQKNTKVDWWSDEQWACLSQTKYPVISTWSLLLYPILLMMLCHKSWGPKSHKKCLRHHCPNLYSVFHPKKTTGRIVSNRTYPTDSHSNQFKFNPWKSH